MNEVGRKKREWIKTAIIVFLTVMLVLTFFSNTIMNYSLPEVAAQYVQSGSITAKIRGNGVVESGDPYNVMVKQTRKVMSVAVQAGTQVQKGDVILYLEDSESEELKAAQEALDAAREAYDLALLSADVNAGIINNAQSNISTETYRKQIDAAQAAVKTAQADVDEWQKQYDAFALQLSITPANSADVYAETKAVNEALKAKNDAEIALTAAQNEQSRLEALLAVEEAKYQETVSGNETQVPEALKNLREQTAAAKLNVINAQTGANNAGVAYEKAAAALEQKRASGDNSATIQNLERQQAVIKVNLDAALKTLEEKQNALSELTGNINKTLSLESLYKAVIQAQELVEKEAAKTIDAVVTADIAGTIMQVNAIAGREVSAAEPVAVIQPEGQGYTMNFTVTSEQAKKLSVGDKAELINSWYYDDMDITLKTIRPNPSNPAQQKQLIFDVQGNVTAGQTLNVSVGQKSANYDLIVPNSAIREDSNGKFVLVVESKSSPLGNRYIATRYDVEVLASDDTKSAVTGALYGWEFVITTATKPVEAGQQVRLAEN
ncbi:MAG: HlyD family efflux transporter periplasmic adaptor subunit [Lachnospiraceae bacterium]|nr:HlyD family efflux transporter periplasmic adaptor subunit [Lachnospiraceae bacterium]